MLIEERVNQRLRELGKKKSWLMSKFNLSSATFWRKITGKTPLTYEEMQILAQSLECSPDFLTGEEEIQLPGTDILQTTVTGFQATQDLDAFMQDLAHMNPDFGVMFRNAVTNWPQLSKKNKEHIAQIFKVGLGLAEIETLKAEDINSDEDL